MTPAIRDEWNGHQSKFASKWRGSMMARKKLKLFSPAERRDLREQIELNDFSHAEQIALRKDCHLMDAALATDRRIMSLDDTARHLFSVASSHITDIRTVLWLNPVTHPDQVITWLSANAPDEEEWRLGHGNLNEEPQ